MRGTACSSISAILAFAEWAGGLARFHSPADVATDAVGNLKVADRYSVPIRKITPSGIVTTLAGSAGLPRSENGNGSACPPKPAQGGSWR